MGATIEALRFIEKPREAFRFVGFADQVAKRAVQHTGWFLADDGWTGETARGVVYRLPAKDGAERFLAGYVTSYSSDDGAAFERETFATELDAALRADRLAELAAEEERDYCAATSAACSILETREEVATIRANALKLAKERRELCASLPADQYPRAAAVIAESIVEAWHEICALREKVEKLRDEGEGRNKTAFLETLGE